MQKNNIIGKILCFDFMVFPKQKPHNFQESLSKKKWGYVFTDTPD